MLHLSSVDVKSKIFKGAIISYAIFALLFFVSWDICWYQHREPYSPAINWFFVTLGASGQVTHMVMLFWVYFRADMVMNYMNRMISGQLEGATIKRVEIWLLIFVITAFMSRAVGHGLLQGDQVRASFLEDPCWGLCVLDQY